MHVNAELTVEGVSGVAKRLVGLSSDGRSGRCVHQNPWTSDNLRLV